MQLITPHLYQIPIGAVNCFVIDGKEDGLILVDTGYKGSTEKIFSAIEKSGRSLKDISQIILTHTHPDHAGSAADIAQRTGAKITLHPADAALAEQGVAGRLPHNVSPGLVNKIIFNLLIKKSPNEIPRFTANHLVNNKDILPFAGGIDVIHTPGHSLGHIALYLRKDDILIAGDICANVMGLGLSTVYEDRDLGIQSILKAARSGFGKAVFGHGKPIMKDAAKKMRAKFERR